MGWGLGFGSILVPLDWNLWFFFGCRHPFDSSKWGRICQFLIKEGVLDKNRVVEPLEALKDDLLVVRRCVFVHNADLNWSAYQIDGLF